jgi:hypothetical protein
MGPIFQGVETVDKSRPRAIKWLDNDEEPTQGPKLVSSKSGDDLNLKESVEPIDNHKKPCETKSAIKNF